MVQNGQNYPGSYLYDHDKDQLDFASSPENQRRPLERNLRPLLYNTRPQSPNSDRGGDVHSETSIDSLEKIMDPKQFERDQQIWLEHLKERGARVVQVIFPRTANNDKELSVYRGEYLQVGL